VPRRLLLLLLSVAPLLLLAPARAANDPTLLWRSIETEHFRVTFNSGEYEVAEHVALLAEDIQHRLAPIVGWVPSGRTEIVLVDQTDSANGSATARPYNAIHLNVTAPDDLSPLGDVDDWYQELVTHEFTHVLHTDHIRGIPALVNVLVGKTLVPNQLEPRWMLEGLAVYEETSRTSGGRLRSSMWNMWMRADVLEANVAYLDEFSNNIRRWPQGNIWYLYGSFFMQWIAQTYGDQAIRTMIDEQSFQIIPYDINRMIRRATGKTFEQLYPEWVLSMQKQYGAQADAIRARGLREGRRLTFGGQTASHPRFIPKSAWPDHEGDLLYYRDDAHTRTGLYAVPLAKDERGDVHAREDDRELLVRTSGDASASFLPDGSLVYNQGDYTKTIFAFNELALLPPGKRAKSGMEGYRKRLTFGFRATEPDVSPDGLHVVFTTNHRGTTYLQIADITGDGSIANVRALVKSEQWEQAFTPRFSPDGVHVAYSVWRKGGYRDIRVVDVRDGSYTAITNDRAIDGGPCFSPDGKRLFFHSDRTGVMNIYAFDLATGATKQVTNVVNGAYQPAISPDGKTLLYTGYTHAGFDIYGMALDESEWPDAEPYVDNRPPAPPEPTRRDFQVVPYNPLHTLAPRSFSVQIQPADFGTAFTVSASGSDIAGHHAVDASLVVESEKPELQGSLGYSYGALPFDVSTSVYRSIGPRGGFQIGNGYKPIWIQETVGADIGVDYSMPRPFDRQSFSIRYSFARSAGELPFPADKLDPYETPGIPQRGFIGFMHLGWAYSNAEAYGWSVSNERGFELGANFDLTDPALASDFAGYSASANFQWYYLMPWFRHHALALHTGAGTSGGNFPGHAGAFYVGGYVDLPVIDTIRNTLIQGGIVLRGYPIVVEAGRYYALFNGEYRFPIVNIDHGTSTVPLFLNRINGNLFVDYGSAFDDAQTAKFKTGVGGELWFDVALGYVVGFTFKLGYARGLASQGIDKAYFVAAIAF
jgi:hypothetical protein